MPRVVPSQVCRFITPTDIAESVRMNGIGATKLAAVLELVGQIPDKLLTMDNDTYASFVNAKAAIKNILETWTANLNAGHALLTFNFHRLNNPLAQIRASLANCPDEAPAPGTSD